MMWRRIGSVALLAALLIWAAEAREAAAQGVRQAAEVVFPSLFPFCVAARQLTSSGALTPRRGGRWTRRAFGLSAAGMGALALGLCGGYPLGVYGACALLRQGAISSDECERLVRVCNNTGPGFFFGMVGAVLFPGWRDCAALFAIHALGAALTAALFAAPAPEAARRPGPPPAGETLAASMREGAAAIARLCGYVIFFGVLLRVGLSTPGANWLLGRLPLPREIAEALVSAVADLPSGVAALARVGDPRLRFVLCAGATGWGGVCVHLQAAALWREAGLRVRGYVAAKAVHAAVSMLLAAALTGPHWLAALPCAAIFVKKAVDFSAKLRYNRGKRPCPHPA